MDAHDIRRRRSHGVMRKLATDGLWLFLVRRLVAFVDHGFKFVICTEATLVGFSILQWSVVG